VRNAQSDAAERDRRRRRQRGQGLVEYSLVISLIAIVAIAALVVLGGDITKTLSDTGTTIGNPGGAHPCVNNCG